MKQRNKGSEVEGREVGAESSLRNGASYHSWRTEYLRLHHEDPGMSLALKETQHITFRKAETSGRRFGKLGWAFLVMCVAD